MIRWLKNLFRRSEQSQTPPCTWLEVGPDNPFDVRILNILPVTQTMTSFTQSKKLAQSFVDLRQSDGSELPDVNIADAELVSCALKISMPNQLDDGPLFKAAEMEDKWDIYTYDSTFYFARSWGGELIYKAPYRVREDAVQIDEIQAAPNHVDKADQTVFFLLTSHVLGQPFPNPIPEGLPDDADQIAMHAFSSFGRQACCATYSDVTKVSLVDTSGSTDRYWPNPAAGLLNY